MGVKARCKFRVRAVVLDAYGEEIELHTEYDKDDSEDTKFSAATPNGSLKFNLSNPNLLGTFKPGQIYYVDLTPVED